LDVLGVRPALGRQFTPEDAVPGAEPVVILSHETWIRRYGGAPDVVGARFEYSDDSALSTQRARTIIGVLLRHSIEGRGSVRTTGRSCDTSAYHERNTPVLVLD
jgi:hypothetical protein